MPDITIRPATPNDLAFILDVVVTTYKEQIIKAHGQFNLHEQTDWWSKNLDPNFHKIIEFLGQPVGLYGVSRTDSEINLELMFIMPEFQGKSITSHLLTALINESKQAGKQLITRCLKCHDSAKGFWLKKGFVIQNIDDKRIYFKYESKL